MAWQPKYPTYPPAPPVSFGDQMQLEELYVSGEELDFKKREASLSRWFNPLLVAVIGAIVVGIVNIHVTYLTTGSAENIAEKNSRLQREMSERQIYNSTAEENMKAEATSVLEVVKLSDPEKVHNGLCLLLKLNSIKTDTTNLAVRGYLKEHNGCDEPKPPDAQWTLKTELVPGCGNSGCYVPTTVCGPVPAGMKPTGNTRNFTDTFAGAWGDWQGAPLIYADRVCRVFMQHSHNVPRTVSFEYETIPTK